jgi:hypothetical protein
MTKDEKWITYPYPTKYRNSNYRTLGLGLLIVLIQVTAITVFYYGWLSILMVALILIEVNVLTYRMLWKTFIDLFST